MPWRGHDLAHAIHARPPAPRSRPARPASERAPGGEDAAAPPPQVEYTKGMPKTLGMMMNDTLGDCTCAAFYHALQVWSFNASKHKAIETERRRRRREAL